MADDRTQGWLPTTAKEVKALGWDHIDVILFTGDAYIDHPSFGTAVIGRLLEAEGYRVAIVPQPNWRDDLRDFKKLGTPRLFFGVSAGSMDSMVNHYTAGKRLRSDDAYTAGGKAGFRPDYAATVYTRILKELFPHVPVVLGGIEASLRRFAHYDYWSDSLKPSILIDSGADIVAYGMGDKSMIEIARAFKNGFNAKLLRKLPQVAFVADKAYVEKLDPGKTIMLNSYEECVTDNRNFAANFVRIETESNLMAQESTIVEPTGGKFVVVNPPYPVMTSGELDRSFDLPYKRLPHLRYSGKGDIPAWEMIKNSVNIHRGCFGGCSFCTISAHQGKFITSRSEKSVLNEVEKVASMPYFKGYISDLGGPSANMYGMGGRDTAKCAVCRRPSCLWPHTCPNLDNSHRRLLELYRRAAQIKGVKKAFIGSGIRYDLWERPQRFDEEPHSKTDTSGTATPSLRTDARSESRGRLQTMPCKEENEVNVAKQSGRNMDEGYEYLRGRNADAGLTKTPSRTERYEVSDDGSEYLREVIVNHTSGRLKVAPEHTEDSVVKLMRKPSFASFEKLNDDFRRICDQEGLKYQLIPYFISSHPGCTEGDMRRLAEKTRRLDFQLEQVQDLTPTPMTLSSVMFYTGGNPYTGEKLYVARSQDDKRRQKSYFFNEKPVRPKPIPPKQWRGR